MTTRGERMTEFLFKRTGGKRGWQTDLVARSGVKRQTITKWTNPKYDGWPDLATLAQLAPALGVKVWEIVAALDGAGPVVELTDETRAMFRGWMEEVLDERLGPPRVRPGSSAA